MINALTAEVDLGGIELTGNATRLGSQKRIAMLGFEQGLKKENNLNLEPDVHWDSILWLRVLHKLSLHSWRGPQVLRSTTVSRF